MSHAMKSPVGPASLIDLIDLGTRVEILDVDRNPVAHGTVDGYGWQRGNPNHAVYLVTLFAGFWSADGRTYVSTTPVHPDNIRAALDGAR